MPLACRWVDAIHLTKARAWVGVPRHTPPSGPLPQQLGSLTWGTTNAKANLGSSKREQHSFFLTIHSCCPVLEVKLCSLLVAHSPTFSSIWTVFLWAIFPQVQTKLAFSLLRSTSTWSLIARSPNHLTPKCNLLALSTTRESLSAANSLYIQHAS